MNSEHFEHPKKEKAQSVHRNVLAPVGFHLASFSMAEATNPFFVRFSWPTGLTQVLLTLRCFQGVFTLPGTMAFSLKRMTFGKIKPR